MLIHFGLALIQQSGLSEFSTEGYNLVSLLTRWSNLLEMTTADKLFEVFSLVLILSLTIVFDFAIEVLVYIFGVVNMCIVPAGTNCSAISKPVRYIMLLVLYIAASALIGYNLVLGYKSL